MKLDKDWKIVFCSQCSEPTPPAQLQKPFLSDGYYCPDCIADLFDNSDSIPNQTLAPLGQRLV